MNRKEQPIIVGLDIGTTKIVAMAGRKNEFGKLEILGLGKAESAGVKHGVVQNIEQCIRAIEQALEKCHVSNPDLEIKDVYVGIAGQHIKSLQTRGDIVRNNADDIITQMDLDRLVKDQYKTVIPAGDKIVDIIPQEYLVDNAPPVTDPRGMNGVKIGANFHIITGDKNAIKNIHRCVEMSGLHTIDLILQPLASAVAIINEQDLEAGVAIVDIGGGTTDMAIFHDGILKHTAVIPYAGTNITEDIRQGLGVLRSQAEQMKVQFGMALPQEANANAYITVPGLRGMEPKHISVKNLAHIIHARMEEIFDYVLYNIKLVNLEKKLHGGIILTGGGSRLKHIVQLCEFVSGISTRIGYPNEHLSGSTGDEAFANPMYATCIGLILRGYVDYENNKLRSAGSNSIQNHNGEVKPMVTEDDDVYIKIEGEDARNELSSVGPEEEKKRKKERQTKINDSIKKVFDQIKNQFMSLFEEPDDMKM